VDLQTIDTLNYMIAGYVVIFGTIIGYLLSIYIRYRKARATYLEYQDHLE